MSASLFAWIKAFHIIFMVCWFAGIFYLPRLFVNHAMDQSEPLNSRLCLMERKLYRFITPLAVPDGAARALDAGGQQPTTSRPDGCMPSWHW
jgi:uncharacterized integral membrane protein (TIGR00701 family)